MSELDNYSEEEKQKAVQRILREKERSHSYYQEHKERKADYYQEHKDEKAEYNRQQYQEHKDVIAVSNRERREERAEYDRQHYQKCKVAVAKRCRQYYQEHRDERVESMHRWHREHPELVKASCHKRRALESSVDGSFTAEEFKVLCETFENRCAYCRQELPLTVDHKVSLSRGGSNRIDNIVPACRYCNMAKYTKTYEEYVERLRQGDEGEGV